MFITQEDGVTPVVAPAGGITVNYAATGTATGGPGGDYTALSGVLFIAPGASSGLIDVNVVNDQLVEGTETVVVTLVNVSPATFPSGDTRRDRHGCGFD